MANFTPVSAAIGGGLIGFSAALFMLLTGRVAGISGIFGGCLSFGISDKGWRIAFIAGLILAPLIASSIGYAMPAPQMPATDPPGAAGRNQDRCRAFGRPGLLMCHPEAQLRAAQAGADGARAPRAATTAYRPDAPQPCRYAPCRHPRYKARARLDHKHRRHRRWQPASRRPVRSS